MGSHKTQVPFCELTSIICLIYGEFHFLSLFKQSYAEPIKYKGKVRNP